MRRIGMGLAVEAAQGTNVINHFCRSRQVLGPSCKLGKREAGNDS